MAILPQPLTLTAPRDLKIGLFIPCYIDLVYPEVGIATLELLERFGLSVEYPLNQTCCGQPISNSGDVSNSAAAKRLFIENFQQYDLSLDRPEAVSSRCVVTSTRWNRLAR